MSSGILKGALWTVLMRLSVRALGVISLLVLARIFSPEQFGLIAKAVLFKEVIALLTQVGIEAALIRNPNATQQDYNTAWTLTIIRGAAICLALIIFAPMISTFFSEPLLKDLILAYAIAMLIQGFTNIGVVDLRKNMTFHLDFNYNMLIKVSEFIPTLLVAIFLESVWAFPIGVIFGSITAVGLSYKFSKRKLSLELSGFKEFFHFGKWMLLHEFSSAIATKFDTFLLGKLSTNKKLGVYTIGNELATLPINEIALPVGRASLPGLSRISDNKEARLLNTQTLLITLAIAIPASLGISSLSDEIVKLMLGIEWMATAPLIKVLAFMGPATVISALSISAIIVKNKVKTLAFTSLINFLIRCATVYFSYLYFGLIGLCYAVVASGFMRAFSLLFLQIKYEFIDLSMFMKGILRPIIASLTMFKVVVIMKETISFDILLITVLTLVAIGAVAYISTSYMLWAVFGRPLGIESFILSKLRKQ